MELWGIDSEIVLGIKRIGVGRMNIERVRDWMWINKDELWEEGKKYGRLICKKMEKSELERMYGVMKEEVGVLKEIVEGIEGMIEVYEEELKRR